MLEISANWKSIYNMNQYHEIKGRGRNKKLLCRYVDRDKTPDAPDKCFLTVVGGTG